MRTIWDRAGDRYQFVISDTMQSNLQWYDWRIKYLPECFKGFPNKEVFISKLWSPSLVDLTWAKCKTFFKSENCKRIRIRSTLLISSNPMRIKEFCKFEIFDFLAVLLKMYFTPNFVEILILEIYSRRVLQISNKFNCLRQFRSTLPFQIICKFLIKTSDISDFGPILPTYQICYFCLISSKFKRFYKFIPVLEHALNLRIL